VTRYRYTVITGYESTDLADGEGTREKVHVMYDYAALELARQRRDQVERAAERARLVREARPRKRRGHETQGR